MAGRFAARPRSHFAHGYLGASFFSPLANQRTDSYGGSLENRLRFHREALDAVRAVWPERLPLTMRLGFDDFNEKGVQFDDAVWAVGELKQHGLDLADLSLGMNTDDIKDAPFRQSWPSQKYQVDQFLADDSVRDRVPEINRVSAQQSRSSPALLLDPRGVALLVLIPPP